MADIDMPLAWRMMQDGYLMQINQLRDENAKLRELVQELYEDQCDECDRWKYSDHMRELGVEVDR